MTVGELKKIIAGLSDDTSVFVYQMNDELYQELSEGCVGKIKNFRGEPIINPRKIIYGYPKGEEDTSMLFLI